MTYRARPITLAGALLLGAMPLFPARSTAQDVPRADRVILSVLDAEFAETVASVWTAIVHRTHRIETRRSQHWVYADLPEEESRRRGMEVPIVVVDDLHQAIRRVFEVEHQTVLELEPQAGPDGSLSVVVDVDADVVVMLATGEGVNEVPAISAPPPAWTRPNGPGYAVRSLGPRRHGDPLIVPVPPGARITLVTGHREIELSSFRTSRFIRVSGIPDDANYGVVARLDSQPITLDSEHRLKLSPDLPPGLYTMQADLTDRRSGETVAWTRRTFAVPARYDLVLSAGAGEECVTLEGEAVAEQIHLRRAAGSSDVVRLRFEPASQRDGLLGAGTRVCAAMALFGWTTPQSYTLSTARGRVPAELRIWTRQQPAALLWAVPMVSFVLFAVLLAWAWWPRRALAVRYIAWTCARERGYREPGPARWRVVLLPHAETPLARIDTSLEGVEHTVVAGPGHARFRATHPVVVWRGPEGTTTLQTGSFDLRAGSQVLDSRLRLALVSATSAESLRAGGRLPEPSVEELERARAVGLMEEIGARKASRLYRATGIVAVAAIACAAPYIPFVVGVNIWPGVRAWTDTLAMWLTSFGVSAIVVLATAAVSRANLRKC